MRETFPHSPSSFPHPVYVIPAKAGIPAPNRHPSVSRPPTSFVHSPTSFPHPPTSFPHTLPSFPHPPTSFPRRRESPCPREATAFRFLPNRRPQQEPTPNPPSTEIDTMRQSSTNHNGNSCPRARRPPVARLQPNAFVPHSSLSFPYSTPSVPSPSSVLLCHSRTHPRHSHEGGNPRPRARIGADASPGAAPLRPP